MDELVASSAEGRGSEIPDAGDEQHSEIARLRERLGFYESFDRLIQENVSRAGQLLREAAETSAGAERRRISAQADFRALLSGLLDEVSAVQGQVERLARQVADALDEVEGDPPAGTPAVADGRRSTAEGTATEQAGLDAGAVLAVDEETAASERERSAEPLPAAAEVAEAGLGPVALIDSPPSIADEAPLPLPVSEPPPSTDIAATEMPPPEMPREPEAPAVADPERFVLETSGERDAVEAPAAPARQPEVRREESGDVPPPAPTPVPATADVATPDAPAEAATVGAATVVLVHGVPRATTALSLKRYLEGLSHVGTVEPREYAEGVLRLQVTSERPLLFDDLRGWADASALEPIHERDDLVEVRMGK